MADSEKFFKCDCHGEGMFITRFEEEEEFYFSYWGQGFYPRNMGLWQRIKMCWQILWKGEAFEDEIILHKDKAGEMAVWINTEINKITIERRSRELLATHRPRTEVSKREEMEQ